MRLKSAATNAVLVLVSIALCFGILELVLRVHSVISPSPSTAAIVAPPPIATAGDEIPDPPAELVALENWRHQLLTIPEEWKRRPAEASGAVSASYWQGVLEVRNSDGMRWTTPIPPKRDDVYRVMVVGDSLTFGDGLEEQSRFSNLLHQWLSKHYNIEFINLGHDGYQSEDVLDVVKKYLPTVRPNLVIYAVCLNDFLPSVYTPGDLGQYSYLNAYPFPLPASVKQVFIVHTYVGEFVNESYDRALRRLHLRADFFDDILRNFNGYQERFQRDVAKMNDLIMSAGLPPLVTIVADQFPNRGGPGYRIARIAEEILIKVGAYVIPTESFYRKFDRRSFHISPWEGHPDEAVNWIWATMIAQRLSSRPELQTFRR